MLLRVRAPRPPPPRARARRRYTTARSRFNLLRQPFEKTVAVYSQTISGDTPVSQTKTTALSFHPGPPHFLHQKKANFLAPR